MKEEKNIFEFIGVISIIAAGIYIIYAIFFSNIPPKTELEMLQLEHQKLQNRAAVKQNIILDIEIQVLNFQIQELKHKQ